jgi:hypothetical protein
MEEGRRGEIENGQGTVVRLRGVRSLTNIYISIFKKKLFEWL